MKRHSFALLSGALLLSGCAALQQSTSLRAVAKVREIWQQVFGAPPTVAPSKP